MRVIFEGKYPLSTTDFTPYMDDLKRINPDVLFLCSYINDSIGLVKAMNAVGLSPKFVGGAMIGPQNGIVKAELGALLNGLVNYEYWLPVPSLLNPQIRSLIATYQSRAEKAGADPLGYYVAPLAYAQLQVLEQAIRAVGSSDDAALSEYTRTAAFETVVGNVTFGEGGGWAQPRVLTAQFQNIESNNISEFKRANTLGGHLSIRDCDYQRDLSPREGGDDRMSQHMTLSPNEAADPLTIGSLRPFAEFRGSNHGIDTKVL